MSRKEKKRSEEKPTDLESRLYERVEKFFEEEKNCLKTGSAITGSISLRIFGGLLYPDVFGVSDPTKDDWEIYMAEGKLRFRGRDFDICKGQALSLQRFADYVYMFFPKMSWNELDEEEKADVITECNNLQIGLLIVDKDSCQEKVKAYPKRDLLKEENRIIAKNFIIKYFPDFFGSEENVEFFRKYVKLADTIVQESYHLIEYLGSSFTKITPVSKKMIKFFPSNNPFEFYLSSKLNNSEVFLIVNPFGSEVFDTKSPTLLIEHRFESSIIEKKGIQQKLSKYIDECLKRKCRVETDDYLFYDTDTADDVLDNLKESGNIDKFFSIFEQIEILGMEKKHIRLKVAKMLQGVMEFSKSLE